MTFKEKLQMEHPEKINNKLKGGCIGCPYYYGYESVGISQEYCIKGDCKGCWNREIPFLTKNKLQDGMTLERRDGQMFLYFGGNLHAIYTGEMEIYRSDLKSLLSKEFDIVKIFQDDKLLFEREEKKKMTHSEIEEALGYEFEYAGE